MTLDLSTQFIDGGAVGVPLDARIELLHETGRMLFLCGADRAVRLVDDRELHRHAVQIGVAGMRTGHFSLSPQRGGRR